MRNCSSRAQHDSWTGNSHSKLCTTSSNSIRVHYIIKIYSNHRQSTEDRWEAFTLQALSDCEEVRQNSVCCNKNLLKFIKNTIKIINENS